MVTAVTFVCRNDFDLKWARETADADRVTADPYVQLGVPPQATDAEIKAAYERAITHAARNELLETAKRVDAAYEVLRNPSRRRHFDRTGIVHELPRMDPADAFFSSPAVPWRAWSPEEQVAATIARTSRRRGAVLPVLAVIVGVLVVVLAVRGARHQAAYIVTGEATGLASAAGASPPVHVTAHPQRLLPVATAPGGTGGYAMESEAGGTPVRWDPCRPIHYVISGGEPFTGANQMVKQALTEASTASGLRFVNDGTTTEIASTNRPSYQPSVYGKTWAPVLIAWTDANHIAGLDGSVIGLGGAASSTIHGQARLVSGIVYFDAPELSLIALRPTGLAQMRTVMLHEIGHLLGLAHVQDPNAVMFPTNAGQGDYSAGDLRGLALAGGATCSRYS